jgi:hypothetical protein
MNPLKRFYQFIKSFQLLDELNVASGGLLLTYLSSGNACAKEFQECAAQIDDPQMRSAFSNHADEWFDATASVGGLISYCDELTGIAEEQEREIAKLREMCKARGLDAADPEEIPF